MSVKDTEVIVRPLVAGVDWGKGPSRGAGR
jgi:hypothetical protein